MISRRRGREFAMQLLYAVEVGKEAFAEALKGLSDDPDLPQDAREYGTRLARRVLEHQQDLDARIASAGVSTECSTPALRAASTLHLPIPLLPWNSASSAPSTINNPQSR